MTACIVGWSHGTFGKRPGADCEDLILEVAGAALASFLLMAASTALMV